MHKKVLIAGGRGLVGSRLTTLLQEKEYKVAFLSRSRNKDGEIKTFGWDLEKGWIEPGAVESAHYIINLAGASVADNRWTNSYKKEILKSRTETTRLLYQELKKTNYLLKGYISASAVGYYGEDNGAHWLYESSPAGNDFLATVCKAWEEEADRIAELGIRLVKIRMGVVLSDEGGALPQLEKQTRMGLAAPIGTGEQYMSWIHIDDLCNIIIKGMEDESMEGVYNAVAPEPETNKRFGETLADVLQKPYVAPRVPAMAIKLMLGSERAGIVLGSQRVSSEKIEKSGFSFEYPHLRGALNDILK